MQTMRTFWRKGEGEGESGIFRLSVVTSPLFLIKSGGSSPSGYVWAHKVDFHSVLEIMLQAD